MGTKLNPGAFDCYENAAPDEPMFVLLARDPMAPILVRLWADLREHAAGNPSKVLEARTCAADMEQWRFRGPAPVLPPVECRSSPTGRHALSEHEGARTSRGVGKACVWCGRHEAEMKGKPMIENTEVITQDQLIPSSMPGRVRVRYPRGAVTLLQIDNAGKAHIQDNPDADGAWERAAVLPNGNLLFCGDTPDAIPTIVLGANLVGL